MTARIPPIQCLLTFEALARLPRDAYARAKAALRGAALELSRDDERRFEEETLPLWTTTAPAAARRALGR